MKNLAFLLLFLPTLLFSQLRQDSLSDRVWVLGYGYIDSVPGEYLIYNVTLDFNSDGIKIRDSIIQNSLNMDYANSSICNQKGGLLFYTNGCSVADSSNHIINGLEKINNGVFQDNLCENLGGSPFVNTTHILPMYPDSIFRLFYVQSKITATSQILGNKLLETKLRRDSNNHITPIYIDSLVFKDSIFVGNLASVRHANGQDWWLISPGHPKGYNILLVTPTKIEKHKQYIGHPTDRWDDSSGEACFSPDGSIYARYTIRADLQIFDFDRCYGTLSNPLHIPIVDAADTIFAAGLAFSPSGRFLYVSSTNYIYQFDMEANDIAASKITVAVFDGFAFYDIFTTNFYQCELAPDNKIYISCPGGKEALHVIEYPDSLGLACQVVQYKLILPYPIAGGLPNFPNFHLGPLVGSGCDTIVFTEIKEVTAGEESGLNFVLYPNPTNDVLTIDLLENINSNAEYIIYNCMGNRVGGDNLKEKTTQISVGQLSAGIYNVVIRLPERIMAVKRFQIIR
jgi:Secretion system C-terminal sorting domain